MSAKQGSDVAPSRWWKRRAKGSTARPYRHVPGSRPPPGQTSIGNLGPLTRTHHRLKTHEPGWRVLQPSPAVFLWRTPTGHWYRVVPWGTHHLGTQISVVEEHLRSALRADRAA